MVTIAALVLCVPAVLAVKALRGHTAVSASEVNERLSRLYEEQGRRHFVDGQTDPALVYLAEAYKLGDRPTLRQLLGLALAGQSGPLDVGFADAPITGYAFSPDGSQLAIASIHDGQHGVFLWNTQTGRLDKTLATTTPVTAFTWKPDSTQIVVASEDGAQYWDIRSGRSSMIDGVRGRIARIVWGSRARALIVDGRTIALSDLTPPRESIALARTPLAFDAERALLCDRTCELVTATSVTPIAVQGEHAAFSRDGTRVAIATATHVHVFDVAGNQLAKLDGTYALPVFSPDGKTLAASDLTTGGRIWDVVTGTLRGTFAGPPTTITSLAFTPDGTRLVTTAADRSARIWDASNGGLIESLQDHDNTVESSALSSAQLATQVLGQSRLRIWTFADERRTPAAVNAIVRCKVPFVLADGRLQPLPVACTE